LLVRYHMTRSVRTFAPSTRAEDALEVMRKNKFRFAPVLEEGELVGTVAERDLLRKLPGSLAELERQAGELILVAHAMSRDIVSIGENDHVETAARLIREHRIDGLTVLDRGRLVGVLTTSDLLHTMMQNEATPDSHRLTVLLPPFGPGLDLARACIDAGLAVNTMMRHRSRGGAFLASVRVSGPWDAVERLIATLRDEGAILINGGEVRKSA